MIEPPISQPIARRSSWLERSIRKEVSEEANALTATPARIKVVVGRLLPTRARLYTRTIVAIAPTKAAIGMVYNPNKPSGQRTAIAITAPSPAPEATPIR